MTSRNNERKTRRAILRQSQQGDEYIDIPVQVPFPNHQRTYSSIDGELEHHLNQQIEHWKAKYYHLQSHLDKYQQFKERYDRLTKRNRQLETQNKEKQYEIEDLTKQIEKKNAEIAELQQKKKQESIQLNKTHKEQIERLKDQLEKSINKLSNVETEERKNKRLSDKELNRVKEQMADVNDQLEISKQFGERLKGQNTILKRKIQDLQINKQVPIQRNIHLTSQIETLSIQLRSKEQQLWRERQSIKGVESKYKIDIQLLTASLQQLKLDNDSKIKKLIAETDRLRYFESQSHNLERQITKLNRIILTKNQQIDILLYKIDSTRRPSGRTSRDSEDEEYYKQFSKLQEQISQKHLKYKKQKQQLEDKIRQIELQFNIQLNKKSKIIEQKSSAILSLQSERERIVRAFELEIRASQESNSKNIETITLLRRQLEQNQLNCKKLKVAFVGLEQSFKTSQYQKQTLIDDNRTIEIKYSKIISELQQYIRNNIYKQNYQIHNGKNDIQQLYEAKLSSKDQLIQLLKLKLKNYECGVLDNMCRTAGSSFY